MKGEDRQSGRSPLARLKATLLPFISVVFATIGAFSLYRAAVGRSLIWLEVGFLVLSIWWLCLAGLNQHNDIQLEPPRNDAADDRRS